MRHPRRRTIMALLLAPACGAGAGAQSDPVIHLAVGQYEAQADAYYAQDLGLFRAAGLNIDIQQYGSGSQIVAATVGGSVQIGAANPLPLAIAYQHGFKIVLIAPGYLYDYAASSPIDALAVGVNSQYRSAKDLVGTTVAVVALRGIDQIAIDTWLEGNGVSAQSVKMVELPQSAMEDAVASGRVAAAQMADPALTAGIDEGKVRILAKNYDAIAKRFLTAAWFATPEWAAQNPLVVHKFSAAINQAAAWATRNPYEAAKILQKYMKVTSTKAHEYHARSLDSSFVQPLLDAAAREKLIAPMSAADIIWKG